MGITLDTIDGLFHSIAIKDSEGHELDVAADGSIAITDNGGSITVDGTVTTNNASGILEDAAVGDAHEVTLIGLVRQDTLATDTTTDGDASYAKVNAKGEQYMIDKDAIALLTTIDADTSSLAGTVSGSELQVDIVASLPAGSNNIGDVDVLTMPGTFAEDSVAVSADFGMHMLAVRADSDAASGADGDYVSLHVNSLGELKVSSKLDNTANSSVVVTNATVNTTVGGVQLISSALSGRRSLIVQNLGTADIWVKDATGVTSGSSGNGFLLPKGSSLDKPWGDNIDLFGITAAGTSTIKTIEAA